MTTSETLYAAADVIERDGWTKGNAGTLVGDGPKCALGALGKAMGVRDAAPRLRGTSTALTPRSRAPWRAGRCATTSATSPRELRRLAVE